MYVKNIKGNIVKSLFLVLGMTFLIAGSQSYAASKVIGKGSSWTWWGSTTAVFTAEYSATSRALSNLNANAKKICPNGYKVLAGPFCKASHKLKTTNKNGRTTWPWYLARAVCRAKIECNKSGRFPNFHKLKREPIGTKKELYTSAIASLNQRYETLSTIDNPEVLLGFVNKWETIEYNEAQFAKQLFMSAEFYPVEMPDYDDMTLQIKDRIYSMDIW